MFELLAGPIVRRATENRVCIWLAVQASFHLTHHPERRKRTDPGSDPSELDPSRCRLGERLVVYLLKARPIDGTTFPRNTLLHYRIDLIEDGRERFIDLAEMNLTYGEAKHPGFSLPDSLRHLLHGSCRKPHGMEAFFATDELAERFDLQLWKHRGWGFSIPTNPPIIALDSRTQGQPDTDYNPPKLLDRYALDWLRVEWLKLKTRPGGFRGWPVFIAATPVMGFAPVELVQRIIRWLAGKLESWKSTDLSASRKNCWVGKAFWRKTSPRSWRRIPGLEISTVSSIYSPP